MAHIMHLIESLEFGGAEKVVVHLANKLSADNKVSICLTKRNGELISELNKNIKVYSLNSPEGNDYSLPGKIHELLNENNVDILNSHDWGVFIESALAIRKSNNVKFIHTVHGPYTNYSEGFKSKIKIKLRHIAEKYLSRYVYKIISVSDSIKEYIICDIKINKDIIETIHNGIDDIGNEDANVNEKSTDDKVKLVTVGRLAKVKNYKLLLNALKKTLESTPNFHLTIVGDGPEKNELIKYCDLLGLNKYVSFLGFRRDIKNILVKSDVFVMSSSYEGISIALLESMSLSMPSIATSVGGLPESILNNETGFLVPPDDAILYAEMIVKVIENKALISLMGRNAREFFLKEFHSDVVLSKYRKTYQDCMET